MTHEVLFRADSQEWATPQALFQALDDEFDFTVDVCACTRRGGFETIRKSDTHNGNPCHEDRCPVSC